MRALLGNIILLYVLLHTSNVFGKNCGITSRLNGPTVQVINLNLHNEWSDYCHSSNRRDYSGWYSSFYYYRSLRRMFAVTCRSLGYETLSTYSIRDYGRNVNKSFSTYVINCQGNEASVDDCDISYSRVTLCRKFYDITCLQCIAGSVRLTGGVVPQQGHVENCVNGRWTRVCYSSWSYQNSFVTCRQLNYPTTELRYYTTGQYYFINQGFNESSHYYQCYGNESRLSHCRSSPSSSCLRDYRNYFRSIILYCGGVFEPRCISGEIRLHMGVDTNEGRLQICNSGIWKAVTSYSWDYYDAEVACRQLYRFQIASTKITWKQMWYTGPKLHVGFRCRGSEHTLQECENRATYYSFYNSIYLRCQLVHSRETCNHGQIRLMEGPVPSEGRLEICLQRKWGTVCRHSWGNQESSIACEQLGFQSENGSLLSGTKYRDGNLPILLSSLYCIRQQNLLECNKASSYIGYHSCSTLNANAVALRCDASTCSHGDVRLYGGYVSWEGFPEVCINGQWMGTCGSNWDSGDSNVFCRQLLNQQDNIRTTQEWSRNTNYRRFPTARKWISNVVCQLRTSTARFTQDCTYTTSNISCSALVVGCLQGTRCTTGSVRLLSLPSSSKKIVEVCKDGVWGSITHWSWDNRDARVVCRQLRQPWEESLATIGQRQSSFFWHGTSCVSLESSILNCGFYATYTLFSNSTNNIFRISYYQAAAVICRGNQTNNIDVCEDGTLRLLNKTGSSAYVQGRVEICDNGQWAGISSNYWGSIHTKLTCQKLLGKSPKAYWTKYYEENGVSTSLIGQVFCPYWATDITNCSVGYNSRGTSYTSATAGVTCLDKTYDIRVNPLNKTTKVYTIGETGQFNCSITPNPSIVDPDVTLTYYWHLSRLSYIYYHSQHITVFFDSRYLKSNQIFCEVRANGIAMNHAYYLIEVEDAVKVTNYEVIKNKINLEVNLRSGSYLNNYFGRLVWYYNNYAIFSSTKTNFADFNTSVNAMIYDGGEYRVRYEGLLVIPHSNVCEKALLDVLQYYPAFRPAFFNERKQDELLSVSSNLGIDSAKHIKFSSKDIINITIMLDLTKISDKYFRQFHLEINNNLNYFRYSRTVSSKYWTRTVSIARGLPTDAGLYEIVLLNSYSSEFISNCSSYYNFIRSSPFSLSRIIREKKYIYLHYYENLTHLFSASRMDYYLSESIQFTCYGNVDIPQFVKISIEKNNQALNASSSHEIQYSASDVHNSQQYGIYKCIIAAEGTTFEQSIYLKNKVDVLMELIFDSSRTCQDNERSINKLVEILTHYFRRVCFCNITSSDFTNTVIKCLDGATGKLQFSATLIYSNDMGDVTAASVIAQVSSKISLSSRGLNVGNNTVINSISYSHGSAQSAELNPKSDSIGISVGAFFGGLILATLSFGIIVAFYCIWKKRSSNVNLQTPAAVQESKYESNCKINTTIIPREYETAVQMNTKNMAALSVRSDRSFEQPMYESVEIIPMSDNIVYGGRVKSSKIQKKNI